MLADTLHLLSAKRGQRPNGRDNPVNETTSLARVFGRRACSAQQFDTQAGFMSSMHKLCFWGAVLVLGACDTPRSEQKSLSTAEVGCPDCGSEHMERSARIQN